MGKTKNTYSGQNVAIIIPTKDRPNKLKNLLNSLAIQNEVCGRVVVVNGGKSVEDVVMHFSDRLPVEYYECNPPGQIRQRNMGISRLDDRTALVGFLDDDIVLEPGAMAAILNHWNRAEPNTAGISFNIVNNKPLGLSFWGPLIGMGKSKQGRVLRSGYNVAISPVEYDLKTQWLCGGATIWRKEIVESYTHREISSKWAISEDVIFSYPIGKKHPLYVSADAKVRHEHVLDHQVKKKHRYYGRTLSLWRMYFVTSHKELSLVSFFLMLGGEVFARMAVGLFTLNFDHVQYALGQVQGASIGIHTLIQGGALIERINEQPV